MTNKPILERIKEVLSGDIFTKDFFKKQYKLLLMIAAFFLIYINSGFRGQAQQQKIRELQNDITEAKTIHSDLSREYTTLTRPSYLNKQLQESGCKVRESLEPIVVIK